MDLRIRPLTLCRVQAEKGIMTYLSYYGERIWRPYIFWVIEGADKKVIVDTAVEAQQYRNYHPGFKGLPFEHFLTFEEALAKASLSPGDIDIIIQTHLHFDHCFNTSKCKNAKVVVQEEEPLTDRNTGAVGRRVLQNPLDKDLFGVAEDDDVPRLGIAEVIRDPIDEERVVRIDRRDHRAGRNVHPDGDEAHDDRGERAGYGKDFDPFEDFAHHPPRFIPETPGETEDHRWLLLLLLSAHPLRSPFPFSYRFVVDTSSWRRWQGLVLPALLAAPAPAKGSQARRESSRSDIRPTFRRCLRRRVR